MKKILLFMILCSVLFTAQAQTNHLEFKGIPINGNINKFVAELKKQGYTEEYKKETDFILKGQFTGKDAEIFILSTRKTHTVWKVAVYVDENASWERLKSDYYEYVKLYTTKYGAPSDNYEYFKDPYYEGDGFELQALKREKCFYHTFFETDKGIITVNITNSGHVSLVYEDGVNAEIMKQEKQCSALDDI